MHPGRAQSLRLLAAASSGALLAASFPPGLPALAWVAFAPLHAAVRRAADRREALRLGLVAGATMTALGITWMVGLLQTFGELPLWACLPLFAAFCLWTAVPFAAWSWVMSSRACPDRLVAAAAAAAFSGIWWSWPAVFPFTVTMGLAARPEWIQAAELGGAPLVEVLVVLCGALLGEAWLARGPARLRLLALALALALACTVAGRWRIASLAHETTRVVRVGLIQPNIPLLWSDKQARLARLRDPSAAAERDGAGLVVWPENLYPWTLDRPFERDLGDDDRILLRHRLPTIFGAGSAADSDAYGYNSVFHMAADGLVRGRFDKVLLVPLGERIPVVDPEWARGLVPGMAHNFAGAGPQRFVVTPGPPDSTAAPVTLGPLICYEDVFAGFAAEVAGQPGGIEAFVNLTNDTWFGATSEPWGHLALAQLRSVEHRIPMLRAVNSGPSSLVDRAGRVVATTDLRAVSVDALVPPEHLVVDLELGRDTASAPTPFARGGWFFVHVCQVIAVLLAAAALRRPRQPTTSGAPSASAPASAARPGTPTATPLRT